MKLLHVISAMNVRDGGPTLAVAGLAAAQVRCGDEVAVVSTWRDGEDLSPVDELRRSNVKVEMVGPARGPLRSCPDLGTTLGRLIEEAAVVHVHGLWEQIQHEAARLAWRAGKPYIVMPHGMLDPWSLEQSRLKKRLYLAWRLGRNLKRAAALHFTTEAERQAAARSGFDLPNFVEPIGVDLDMFRAPAAGTFRARHEVIGNRPLVLYLGRIHPGKGLEYLVPAMAGIDRHDAMLAIVGPDVDGYRTQVEVSIAACDLQQRVVFAGLLGGVQKVAALADADLFCLPSDHENFGMAVVEALAAGTPVVISDKVAIGPQIRAAEVGAVIPNRVEPLTAELNRWLGDEPLRRAAAARCRPFVAETYDWNAIARRWSGHYGSLR